MAPRDMADQALKDFIYGLKPGDRVYLVVEIFDFPQGDMTNIRVGMRGFEQRFWVPTENLRPACVEPQRSAVSS
jgi:hypothetical protein